MPVNRNPVDRYFLRAAARTAEEGDAEAFEEPWRLIEPLAAFFDPFRCVGLFSMHSKINHSCDPNAFVVGHAMESILPVVSSFVNDHGGIHDDVLEEVRV